MRVLLNTITALRRRTGIGHYVGQLLRCFADQAAGLDVVPFPGRIVRQVLRCKGAGRTKHTSAAPHPLVNRVSRTLASWHFQAFASRRDFDLYHEPNFIPLPCDRPTVATLLDLSVMLHPHWHPSDRVRHFERHLDQGLRRCDHFFAISDVCRQELIDQLGIPAHKITRTYMGVRPDFRPMTEQAIRPTLNRLHLPNKYLLYVGTLEPRKNILSLLKAYCALPEALRSRCPLVLAGSWGWRTQELAEFYHLEARHRGVIHLGYLADGDLPALYNGARALVFPSYYEGFGLPPLEMMACGGAVLASTAAAIRETTGGKAHLIDPHDLQGWRQAMARVVQDGDWREELRRDVATVARTYTWETCAQQTLEVYRQVCHGRRHTRLAA